MNDHRSIVIVANGRVQGVFYRDSTREKALELGLSGTVQNLPDGTVRIVAQGPESGIEALVQWARQGPPASSVSHLDLTYDGPTGKFDKFKIIY
jgi:acylphosphatase